MFVDLTWFDGVWDDIIGELKFLNKCFIMVVFVWMVALL
jgi:hypothetical protein